MHVDICEKRWEFFFVKKIKATFLWKDKAM